MLYNGCPKFGVVAVWIFCRSDVKLDYVKTIKPKLYCYKTVLSSSIQIWNTVDDQKLTI